MEVYMSFVFQTHLHHHDHQRTHHRWFECPRILQCMSQDGVRHHGASWRIHIIQLEWHFTNQTDNISTQMIASCATIHISALTARNNVNVPLKSEFEFPEPRMSISKRKRIWTTRLLEHSPMLAFSSEDSTAKRAKNKHRLPKKCPKSDRAPR